MKRTRAFTLIELLVVVSIIALLIAILLPSLKKARQTSEMVVCSSNLRQMGVVAVSYSSEFSGYYLPQSVPAVGYGPANRLEYYQMPYFLEGMGIHPPKGWWFFNTPRKYICPQATWVLNNPGGAADKNTKYTGPTVIDPTGLYRLDLTYGMNAGPVTTINGNRVETGMPSWTDPAGNQQSDKVVRAMLSTKVVNPSRKMYMMDSMWSDPTYGGRVLYPTNPDATFIPAANQWAIAWRHFYDGNRGQVNVLMYDGHVEPMWAGTSSAEPLSDVKLWEPIIY